MDETERKTAAHLSNNYPTAEEVEMSWRSMLLMFWHCLRDPANSDEAVILKRIGERLEETE